MRYWRMRNLPADNTFYLDPVGLPAGYQTGQWPTYPDLLTAIEFEKDTTVLSGDPQVTMTDAWTAQITFTTAISAPALSRGRSVMGCNSGVLAVPRLQAAFPTLIIPQAA